MNWTVEQLAEWHRLYTGAPAPYGNTINWNALWRKEPEVAAKCKECLAEVTLDNVEEFRKDKEGGWVHRHPAVCTATLREMVKGHERDVKALGERVAALEKACWDKSIWTTGVGKDSFLYRIRKLEETQATGRRKFLGIF